MTTLLEQHADAVELGPEHAQRTARWRFLPGTLAPWETVALVTLLVLVFLAHAINMFHFPYFEDDEGTYMSQAWAVSEHGELAPYTYWYDHAPGGWLLIAMWAKITGGYNAFGFSINSGRVLMLILHLASSLLIYAIVRKITLRPWAGLLAVALFSFGGDGIYYQRRVLLDNIAVFWLMAAVAALVYARGRLSRLAVSAVLLGIAVLSKETIVFVAPVMVVAAVFMTQRGQRALAAALYAGIISVLGATYFLFALLKGEFFPAGSLLGGSRPHVSLLDTIEFQSGRTGGSGVLAADSNFRTSLTEWFVNDPVWVVLAFVVTVVILVMAVRRPQARLAAAMLAAYWLFLVRGGVVLSFYVVPLYAFVALAGGVAVGLLLPGVWVRRNMVRKASLVTAAAAMTAAIIVMFAVSQGNQRGWSLYATDQTRGQLEAVQWLLSRTDARVVAIDNYAYIETHSGSVPPHLRAEYYWKLDRDPQIQRAVGDSSNIDYIALTPQMNADLPGLNFPHEALNTSRPIASFSSDGWGVEVWANMVPHRMLNSAWRSFVTTFTSNGRVVDPEQEGRTLAWQQASALFRAVQSDDRASFDRLASWASSNLADSGVWATSWPPAGATRPVPSTIDADATIDAALAYVLAGRRWADPDYTRSAVQLASAIWERSVVQTARGPVVVAQSAGVAVPEANVLVSPGTMNPAAYRALATVDTQHDWQAVLDGSFRMLKACSTEGYPPRLCAIDKSAGTGEAVVQPTGIINDLRTSELGTRLAIDYQWSGDRRDLVAAGEVLRPLTMAWSVSGELAADYDTTGAAKENFESAMSYGGYVGAFTLLEPANVLAVYERGLRDQFFDDGPRSYWQDPRNAAAQADAWTGMALASGTLSAFSG